MDHKDDVLMNWSKYKNFSRHEFACSHTDKCEMDGGFMSCLQALRTDCGFPFKITSGYRSITHPIEARKSKPGEHSTGQAADISVELENAYKVLELAPKHGFVRIGIKQHGSGRYIHLGTNENYPNPRVWTYKGEMK